VNQDLYNNYGDKPINFCSKKKGELAKYMSQLKKELTVGQTIGREKEITFGVTAGEEKEKFKKRQLNGAAKFGQTLLLKTIREEEDVEI
jgi:hypothetical protein